MLAEDLLVRLRADRHGVLLAQEKPREADEPWHGHRPLQAAIVTAEPALVLGKADIHELGGFDVDADRFAARDGEVVVGVGRAAEAAGDADALPDEECPDREHFCPEPRPAPPRQIAPVPRDPIYEEEDVAAFLLHHRFERVDELGREIARPLGDLEKAEGEETVDAFAEAGDHEGPFGVARLQIGRFGREFDAIGLDHIGENVLVPAFLEPVQIDRLAQQRIGDRVAIAQHAQLRLALGLHGDVPDRQADEAVARLVVELGPIDDRGLIGIEGVEQHPAEHGLVPVAAGADGTGVFFLPKARDPVRRDRGICHGR
jgi:hypothetical protein